MNGVAAATKSIANDVLAQLDAMKSSLLAMAGNLTTVVQEKVDTP